ncbi:tumor necrosis factor receptor superfamily member 1B [Tachysurus fulvidraco]|uniref:tumor necrosis factor receptor superfamily member 1B n=1 Tax=Tachysurus fulvidraco TaxID=1234273 RepID=UPI001FEF95CD|nr:tumor necrosis factor receptor superfamily member 1B [Tachysurus fulvidraco]XP_027002083.2 tumor necrosis factor receptor superfamily member 1B [Tachysurus fulvidraco]XP_027002084.2 tumor necrosis factor receptor superfamily member 1B [Tachysurus fulvidraco]
MHCQSSFFIWSFLSLVTIYQDHVASEIVCKPGERATHSKTKCEPCPDNQYNPKKSSSIECQNCEPCGLHSYKILACTSTSNTKCHCRSGFIPYDKTLKRCYCPIGSGIIISENGFPICEKCPPKTFTNTSNSKCQPRHVLIIPGTTTSDVSSVNEAAPSSTLSFSQTYNSTPTTAPTTSRNYSTTSTPATSIPGLHDRRAHAIWLASPAAFLLLILILKLTGCSKKKIDIVRQGSECGKPIEESGEKFIPAV